MYLFNKIKLATLCLSLFSSSLIYASVPKANHNENLLNGTYKGFFVARSSSEENPTNFTAVTASNEYCIFNVTAQIHDEQIDWSGHLDTDGQPKGLVCNHKIFKPFTEGFKLKNYHGGKSNINYKIKSLFDFINQVKLKMYVTKGSSNKLIVYRRNFKIEDNNTNQLFGYVNLNQDNNM